MVPPHLESRPAILYHYTNAAGLEGILKSRSLWGTQFDFLNDASEYDYAVGVLMECLPSSDLYDHHIQLEIARMFPHYVVSFCDSGDLLSQWRGYSSTNDAYAIGFRFDRLSKKADLERGGQFVKLEYSRTAQKALLDKVLNRDGGSVSDAANLLLRIKDEHFESEREWRLIAHSNALGDDSQVGFRTMKGHIVPYFAFALDDDDIVEIVQGPGSFRPANLIAIERFARSRRFSPTVRKSEIPLA